MPEAIVGPEAIDHLVRAYPRCHTFFGEHASAEHFALVLEGDDWRVLEYAGCWVFLECLGEGIYGGHFFCPEGFRPGPVRTCLEHAFRALGVRTVVGITPPGHPCERQARCAARALGMVKHNGVFALTLAGMLAYNVKGKSTEGV